MSGRIRRDCTAVAGRGGADDRKDEGTPVDPPMNPTEALLDALADDDEEDAGEDGE